MQPFLFRCGNDSLDTDIVGLNFLNYTFFPADGAILLAIPDSIDASTGRGPHGGSSVQKNWYGEISCVQVGTILTFSVSSQRIE